MWCAIHVCAWVTHKLHVAKTQMWFVGCKKNWVIFMLCCMWHDQSSPSFTTFVVNYFDCSPNYFWNALCVSVPIFPNVRILSYLERSTRTVLMRPNAIVSFSLWGFKWKTFFCSPTSCTRSFIQGTYPTSCINPNNLCNYAWISII
jgi:hypothetical protein